MVEEAEEAVAVVVAEEAEVEEVAAFR